MGGIIELNLGKIEKKNPQNSSLEGGDIYLVATFQQRPCCQPLLNSQKMCQESSSQYTDLQRKQTPLSLGYYSTFINNHHEKLRKRVASNQTRILVFPPSF